MWAQKQFKTKRAYFLIVSIFVFTALIITTFSAAVNIYEKRTKIAEYFERKTSSTDYDQINESDLYWAEEIMNGGYILHFRHAERDKWIDVQMYDALESDVHEKGHDETRYAENDYFAEAVCLNNRGKIQARAIGEHLKNIGLPIGPVVSSVSCRSRQTADLAFGGYNSLHRILVHTGPYNEDTKLRVDSLKRFYSDLPIQSGKNTIVSAHNSVIKCEMFINDKCLSKPSLEEGGFYVISQNGDGLIFEYEFHNFNHFNRVFYER